MAYEPLVDYRTRVDEVAKTLEHDTEAHAIFRRVADRVDPAHVRALQEKYAADLVDFDPIALFKYADIPWWLADKVSLVRELGLHRCEPRRILDIGMGAGHFAAVCQSLGHTVVGTDISVPLYDDICIALDVDRRIEPTRWRTPLPSLGQKFDVVIVIWQMFHIIRYLPDGNREHWSVDDWEFFLRDLVERHMTPPGAIFLHLNKNVSAVGQAFDAPLLSWARDHGASIDEAWGKIHLDTVASWDSIDNAGPRPLAVAAAP